MRNLTGHMAPAAWHFTRADFIYEGLMLSMQLQHRLYKPTCGGSPLADPLAEGLQVAHQALAPPLPILGKGAPRYLLQTHVADQPVQIGGALGC